MSSDRNRRITNVGATEIASQRVKDYKPRIIPEERLKQMARASHEGGRAYCSICRRTYGMTAAGMKIVKVSMFEEAMTCKWCRKLHNLR
jgi:hypothetical protein